MARLESQAKAGYYPTPNIVVEQIVRMLEVEYHREAEKRVLRMLDPCCGTGEALMLVAERLKASHRPKIETFGIELSVDRAREADAILDNVLGADLFNTSIANGMFSLLYLNPPYDYVGPSEDGSKRTELAFLQRCTNYLQAKDGILVYIIPQEIIRGNLLRYLSAHYHSLTCWQFPEEEWLRFGQVVIMGKRREHPYPDSGVEDVISRWSTVAPDYDVAWRGGARFGLARYRLVSSPSRKILFNNLFHDPGMIAEEAAAKGLWQNPLLRQSLWPDTDVRRRPLMPLRQGHVAMLTAAGFLDNMVLERDGQRILVKGRTFKEYEITEETEEKIVRIERMRTSVISLDLDSGEFADIKA